MFSVGSPGFVAGRGSASFSLPRYDVAGLPLEYHNKLLNVCLGWCGRRGRGRTWLYTINRVGKVLVGSGDREPRKIRQFFGIIKASENEIISSCRGGFWDGSKFLVSRGRRWIVKKPRRKSKIQENTKNFDKRKKKPGRNRVPKAVAASGCGGGIWRSRNLTLGQWQCCKSELRLSTLKKLKLWTSKTHLFYLSAGQSEHISSGIAMPRRGRENQNIFGSNVL